MLSWLAGKLIAHNTRRLREGDPSPTVRMYDEGIPTGFSWHQAICAATSTPRLSIG
jgi:hypothetical protein